jgi:hypothetical protein
MSQNDYTIANQTTPLFRADLNNALQALASNSSGATAPATTYANMTWYDTGTNTLYMRSEADDAWIALGTLNQSTNTFTPAGSLTLASQAEAEAGTDNTKVMTPLRVEQAIVDRFNVSGSAPTYACRAWVNFDGTGTVAIRASGNVSSITDQGVGDYLINFVTAMPDANYIVVGTAMGTESAIDTRALSGGSGNLQTTTGASVRTSVLNTSGPHGGGSDTPKVFVAIFR